MSKNPKERDGGKQDEDLGRKKATADPDNNLSGGAPFDRDEKIEHQREERPEHRGRSEGEAHTSDGSASRTIWTGRMPPSSAKALPARSRAYDRRAMPILCGRKANEVLIWSHLGKRQP